MQQCADRMCTSLAWDKTSASCVSTAMQQESYYPAGDPAESPSTSVSAKLSGQRAYLQSLDRSSRAWVLSSGKTSDEVCDPQEDSGSNIWYNPIPEEEDLGGLRRDEDVWKRRAKKDEPSAGADVGGGCSSASPLEDFQCSSLPNPSVSHHIDDIQAENTGKTSCYTCCHHIAQVLSSLAFFISPCFRLSSRL